MSKEKNYTNYNYWKLIQRFDKLEGRVMAEFQEDYFYNFRPIDYSEYITQPLANFEKLWKYDGVYYDRNNTKNLFDLVVKKEGYSKQLPAFRVMLNKDDNYNDIWSLRIQTIYAKFIDSAKKYITCEGFFLTGKSRSLIRGNPASNSLSMMIDGENFVISRSETVWRVFIDPTITDNYPLFFIDNSFGNCGIDNLQPRQVGMTTKGTYDYEPETGADE